MIRTLTLYSFLLMLIAGLVLPSDGNHGLFSPKTLSFLCGVFFFSLYALSRFKVNSAQLGGLLVVSAAIFFFGVWYVVGINQDPLIPSGQFDQFKVFMTTLFVPFSTWYLIQDGLLTPKMFFRTTIMAQTAYCTLKVMLMVLHVLKVINIWAILPATGFRFMSMAIVGDLGRVQTSVDILTPFLVFFVLQADNWQLGIGKRFKVFFLLISFASTLLSFSRYLIFIYCFSVFLHGLTLNLSKQIKYWSACLLVLIMAVIAAGPSRVYEAIHMRFFSQNNYQSDADRRIQVDALMDQCERYPFFGNGLGGYTKECIRDIELPHAYEVQWVAFLMQFGLIGVMIILLPLIWIGVRLVMPPMNRSKMGALSLYCLWLLSGFTNPFLISLTSGIAYTLFLLFPCKAALQQKILPSVK